MRSSHEVDSRRLGLRMLEFARDAVDFSVLAKACARLLEVERHVRRFALAAELQYPAVVADPRLIAGFAARDDAFYGGIKIWGKLDRGEKRFADDLFMSDFRLLENRKPEPRHVVVLDGAAVTFG